MIAGVFQDAQQQSHWLSIARRYCRPGIDPADVLQEACIAAFRNTKVDLESDAGQRYFRGIIRKTAWRMLRAHARRQSHELKQGTHPEPAHESTEAAAPDLSSLPPSLQSVANLVMANLSRDEIRSALSISDDALRRRLSDLRRHLEADPLAREEILMAIRSRPAPPDVGLVRQALVIWLRRRAGHALGTVDPDGHLIAFSEKSAPKLTNDNRPATHE